MKIAMKFHENCNYGVHKRLHITSLLALKCIHANISLIKKILHNASYSIY